MSGTDNARHGSALGEITCQEPIDSGSKFQDNHIYPEKRVSSAQESIPEGSHPPKKSPNHHDCPTKGSQ